MYEVLIVEDDPMVAMLNKQYVSENPDFRVCEICKDGASALDYLSKQKVDLVILDVYMSRMDGISLLSKIRENKINVGVIMVTAANDSLTVEKALQLGITDYLVKPFLSSRFNKALETFKIRKNALKDSSNLNQKNIDALMGNFQKEDSNLPKGIQKQTLNMILNFLEKSEAKECTGEEIAENVSLSVVTVRRYMNYLVERELIFSRMNYETGGRPSMVFSIK